MCTAVSYTGDRHYFGRTLDVDSVYGERVIVTPGKYRFDYLHEPYVTDHYSMIGIGCVYGGRPLYYDAVNERGLAAAGLNFVGNAVYHPYTEKKHNVASFEFIPWLLGCCSDVKEAVKLLSGTVITDESVSTELPASPLHFIISDKSGSVAVESDKNGLNVYENSYGVLTNNPAFPYHIIRAAECMGLSPHQPENTLCKDGDLPAYSRGLGAVGLPGDFSSASRFIRALYIKSHISETDGIGAFFHIMDSVNVPKGCVLTDDGKPSYTVYTSCADTEAAVYYYTTCYDRSVRRTALNEVDTSGCELVFSDVFGCL